MRHHPQQPLVVNRLKEAANVGIEHPVHALAHDRCMQRIKGQLRGSPRPEAIREPAEVDLIYGAHHFGDRALDDFVFERWHTERALATIGFGNVDTTHRLWPVSSCVDPDAEIPEIILQSFRIFHHCHPIDSGTRLPLLSAERPVKGAFVDVVQQGGEPGLGSLPGCRVHPRKIGLQGTPALRPGPGRLERDPLGLAPSLHASRFLRRFHWYYEPVRIPTSARTATPAVPCCCPPQETNPADPVGPLMFR